jgi:hypothetical protein
MPPGPFQHPRRARRGTLPHRSAPCEISYVVDRKKAATHDEEGFWDSARVLLVLDDFSGSGHRGEDETRGERVEARRLVPVSIL